MPLVKALSSQLQYGTPTVRNFREPPCALSFVRPFGPTRRKAQEASQTAGQNAPLINARDSLGSGSHLVDQTAQQNWILGSQRISG